MRYRTYLQVNLKLPPGVREGEIYIRYCSLLFGSDKESYDDTETPE